MDGPSIAWVEGPAYTDEACASLISRGGMTSLAEILQRVSTAAYQAAAASAGDGCGGRSGP